MCDKRLEVTFETNHCLICWKECLLEREFKISTWLILKILILIIFFAYLLKRMIHGFGIKALHTFTWHTKLVKRKLVNGLPEIKFEPDRLCDACQKGKQVKTSFKSKQLVCTSNALELILMDLFGPSRNRSIGVNYYALVLLDDYSRYTWIFFIPTKNDTFKVFKKIANVIQNEKDLRIKSIRSYHGGEFQNAIFETFCEENVISHNFSALRTPQQNCVLERKNISLVELSRTMLNENNFLKYFWVDAISTTCYVLNRVLIKPILKLTPYELFKGRKPIISHLKIFGCKWFILNNEQ